MLVVDDSDAVRELLVRELSKPPLAARVVEAKDGADGLRRVFDEGPFDCVICDILMPTLDGMSFLKQLRVRYSRLEVPVVFLTVRETTQDKVVGFRAGASDFLVKPIETEELVARVETQVHLARMYRQTSQLTERLRVLVDTDPLTGLGNRRAFMRRLHEEFGRAERAKKSMGLLMIDVDKFKSVNDQHGHQTGDAVLVAVADALASSGRKYDMVARIGGEEFAVILPEVTADTVFTVGERMRAAVEAVKTDVDAVTISVGIGLGPTGDKDYAEAVFRRADENLFEAKRKGRNLVWPQS